METFGRTIENFLSALYKFEGAKPIFSIDFENNHICLTYAPCGFIKQLAKDDRVLMFLKDGLIIINWFQDQQAN